MQRKRQLEQQPPESAGALSRDPAGGPAEHRPCADVRFDGVGDETLHDDDLGPKATQLRLLGLLYRLGIGPGPGLRLWLELELKRELELESGLGSGLGPGLGLG